MVPSSLTFTKLIRTIYVSRFLLRSDVVTRAWIPGMHLVGSDAFPVCARGASADYLPTCRYAEIILTIWDSSSEHCCYRNALRLNGYNIRYQLTIFDTSEDTISLL